MTFQIFSIDWRHSVTPSDVPCTIEKDTSPKVFRYSPQLWERVGKMSSKISTRIHSAHSEYRIHRLSEFSWFIAFPRPNISVQSFAENFICIILCTMWIATIKKMRKLMKQWLTNFLLFVVNNAWEDQRIKLTFQACSQVLFWISFKNFI